MRSTLLTLLLLAWGTFAQVDVSGSILDIDLQGVPDVVITAPEYGLEARSDSNGVFTIYAITTSAVKPVVKPVGLVLDPNVIYRVIVPNGARRLLPVSELAQLPDGIYYLVSGRNYHAEQRVLILNGRVMSQVYLAGNGSKSMSKVTATTTLRVVKSGLVDTSVVVNPLKDSVNLVLNKSTTVNIGNGSTVNVISGTQGSDLLDARDNKTYPTVQIGNLLWMAANLNYDTANGTGSWCPANLATNCAIYGRLYNWVTAMDVAKTYTSTLWAGDDANHQGICPDSWRIPSEGDWESLELAIGMTQSQIDSTGWRGNGFGAGLKSINLWTSGSHTNTTGFAALPSGYYNTSKTGAPGTNAFFWTATENNAIVADSRYLLGAYSSINRSVHPKGLAAIAVRCVTDAVGTPTQYSSSSSLEPSSSSEEISSSSAIPSSSSIAKGEGYVIWEKWKHVRGDTLGSVDWTSVPNEKGIWNSLEASSNSDDRFGLRVRGYITAPSSGDYVFLVHSNGAIKFSLSPDSTGGFLTKVLDVADKESTTLTLKQGKKYYFEALWKENWQNEYFQILWSKPGDLSTTPSEVVPGEWLSPVTDIPTYPLICNTITPTAPDSAWPAYCRAKAGNCGTFIDERDCREYRWTQIGTQKWMAENLNYGTRIDGAKNMTDNSLVEKYCYNNQDSMCNVYGGLYQWHEAMGLNDSCMTKSCKDQVQPENQGICPDGWLLSSNNSWKILFTHSSDQLKSSIRWNQKYFGTDNFGFSAFGAGERDESVNLFVFVDQVGAWWTSTGNIQGAGNASIADTASTGTIRPFISKAFGSSIRCTTN